MRKGLLALSLVCLINYVYADVANTAINSTIEQNTQIISTLTGNPQDWGLTPAEWTRYQQLMQGPDGRWYPHLTPPEVLGLHAKNPREQQHFAEIVAKEEHDKLANELAFDHAVHLAMLRLYPDEPVIQAFDISLFNPIKHPKHNNMTSLQSGDHLSLFVDPMQGFDVGTLPLLIQKVKNNADIVLDIFCVGKTDDNTVRSWAKLNRIPMDLVAKGRITLNQDNGQLQKIAGNVSLPFVLLIRNGMSQPISPEALI